MSDRKLYYETLPKDLLVSLCVAKDLQLDTMDEAMKDLCEPRPDCAANYPDWYPQKVRRISRYAVRRIANLERKWINAQLKIAELTAPKKRGKR